MLKEEKKIGFGGGCHWCTEGVFNSILGVSKVEQGWISSILPHDSFSEAIIVHFDIGKIDLHTLISIHLHTHSSTANHSLREKYRSAIYYFNDEQKLEVEKALKLIQEEFQLPIITKTIPFVSFKLNTETYLDYLYTRPQGLFCESSIYPKLKTLLERFGKHVNKQKLIDNKINL